jgi:hypothetical protein
MSIQATASPTRYAAPSRHRDLALWVLVALFALGLVSLVYALRSETAQLDLRLLTVSFLYLMGISQTGIVFCAMTRLMRARWARPYYRLAELGTMAFCPFAIVIFLLIYAYGRDDLFYWLANAAEGPASPWLNDQWLLIRNLFGLLLFYGLGAVYVLKSVAPDLQTGRTDVAAVERQLYLLSPWIIVAFVVSNTFFAWDFGMMLIPHWHSTVFPIHYWFGSLFAGTAALIVFPAVLGASHDDASPFGPEQIRSLGMLLTAFTLMWLYFFWAQFFVIWFGNMPREFEPLWRQMYGHYAPFYWAMMTGCFFLPFAAFIFAVVKRSLPAMCFIAFGVNVGVWINKYLIVVPPLTQDDRPFDAWLDVSIAVGLAAGFVATIMLLAGRLPIYSRWEMALLAEAKR